MKAYQAGWHIVKSRRLFVYLYPQVREAQLSMSLEDRWCNQVGLDVLALLPRGTRREKRCIAGQRRVVSKALRLTHPIITLNEPRGVTNIGGAKEYAAKFATSERGVKRI